MGTCHLFRYIFLVSIAVTLSACGDMSVRDDQTNEYSTCPANKALNTSSTALVKFNRADFDPNYDTLYTSSQKTKEVIINTDRALSVLVDTKCLSDSKRYKSLLTENLKFKRLPAQFGDTQSLSIQLGNDLSLDELEDLVYSDECIRSLSPEVSLSLAALPNDPGISNQTHLPAIKYEQVYEFFFTGGNSIKNDTIIAVIDDGIDLNHSELKSVLWRNMAEFNGQSGVDDDGNGYVDDIYGYNFGSDSGNPSHNHGGTAAQNSHGTHVSGIIAAATNNSSGIAGVMAKNTKLMSLNIFNNGQGSTTALNEAIRYAVAMGAKVINMSLSGQGTHIPSVQQALQHAVNNGVIVVSAAGNDGLNLSSSNAPYVLPGNYGRIINGMITVGATDARLSTLGALCWFSNHGATFVEIGAPGCYATTNSNANGLYSTIRNNNYGYLVGTSMASPIVAASAAIVYSYVRDVHGTTLTPAQVESLLKTGSREIASLTQIEGRKNLDLESIKAKIQSTFTNPGPGGPIDPCP